MLGEEREIGIMSSEPLFTDQQSTFLYAKTPNRLTIGDVFAPFRPIFCRDNARTQEPRITPGIVLRMLRVLLLAAALGALVHPASAQVNGSEYLDELCKLMLKKKLHETKNVISRENLVLPIEKLRFHIETGGQEFGPVTYSEGELLAFRKGIRCVAEAVGIEVEFLKEPGDQDAVLAVVPKHRKWPELNSWDPSRTLPRNTLVRAVPNTGIMQFVRGDDVFEELQSVLILFRPSRIFTNRCWGILSVSEQHQYFLILGFDHLRTEELPSNFSRNHTFKRIYGCLAGVLFRGFDADLTETALNVYSFYSSPRE